MNLTKYITLNLISLLGHILLIFLVYIYIGLELSLTSNIDIPIPRIQSFLSYLFDFYLVTIILHILFIIETVIRLKKPNLIPEIKVPNRLKILHNILFYIGWIIAILVITMITSFVIDVETSDSVRFLKPIPFDMTVD